MTDKQIIDVSQCPHYKRGNVCTFLPYETKCEGECIWVTYKEMEEQRKRSEAQCEAMFVSHTDLEKKYKAKEQECKKLKKQLEEESKLGHKAIQDEANTFFDLLKIQKELGYLKEALEKEFITYRIEGFVPVFAYKGYELDKLIGENNQLKAKNEELKKQVDNLLHKPEIQDKILWKIDNEALLGSKDAYIYKLEKTLTEIKEIVKEQLPTVNYNFAKSMHPEMFNCYEQILQKISEVEDV